MTGSGGLAGPWGRRARVGNAGSLELPERRAAGGGLGSLDEVDTWLLGLPVALITLRPNGRVHRANRAARRMLAGELLEEGASLDAVLGPRVGPDEHLLSRTTDPLLTALADARRNPPTRVGFHGPDGGRRWVDLATDPLLDGTLVTLIDRTGERELTTEVARLQAQLARADRRSTAGTLAGAVAHEVKNHLVPVIHGLDELADAFERPWTETSRTLELLIEVRAAAIQAAEIARDLLDLTRDEACPPVLVSVNAIVESALRLARAQVARQAQIEVDLSDVPLVLGHPTRLVQVVLNLLLNAGHATAEAGRPGTITVRSEAVGGEVRITVGDTGAGIAPRDLPRLFEPHFSRRAHGAGGGLGLTVCDTIVRAHQGRVSVDSEEGAGARFTVCLPAATGEALLAQPSPPPGARGPTGRPRLLLIEDQRVVRRALVRMFEQHFDVVPAGGVGEATAVLEQQPDVALILCDMSLLDGSGVDVHDWLRAHTPAMVDRVVYMTGGVFTAGARAFLTERGFPWVEKPFAIGTVLRHFATMQEAAAAG